MTVSSEKHTGDELKAVGLLIYRRFFETVSLEMHTGSSWIAYIIQPWNLVVLLIRDGRLRAIWERTMLSTPVISQSREITNILHWEDWLALD